MADKKQQNTPELKFTVLGPSGAGKTTLLACMYNEFEEMRSGMLVPDTMTSRILLGAYTKLRNAANDKSSAVFSTAIAATEDKREFRFTIKGKNAQIPIHFYDFPGDWMSPDSTHFEEVVDIVRDSIAILIAVNTPYVMEEGGKYHAEGALSSDAIHHVINSSYANFEGGKDKLILLVPIKCEKYTRTPSATREMRERIKEKGIFRKTITLVNNPAYKDNLSMVILPVHTVGNAEFSAFKKDSSGRIAGEVYRKTQGQFNPKNTEQPFRFVMSFILNEYAKLLVAQASGDKSGGNAAGGAIGGALAGAAIGSLIPIIGTTMGAVIGGLWGAVSGSGSNDNSSARQQLLEFIELGDFIRSGMNLDDPEIEIINGRDKLEEVPLEQIEELMEGTYLSSASHDASGLSKEEIIRITKEHGFDDAMWENLTKKIHDIPKEATIYTEQNWFKFPFKNYTMYFCSDKIYWQGDISSTLCSRGSLSYEELVLPYVDASWLLDKFKNFPSCDIIIDTLLSLKYCALQQK